MIHAEMTDNIMMQHTEVKILHNQMPLPPVPAVVVSGGAPAAGTVI